MTASTALYRINRRFGAVLGAVLFSAGLLAAPAQAASRIKDIVSFEGVRTNMLIGYGLVVGLKNTGDSLRNSPMTRETLIAMLERLGVNARDPQFDVKNVAAVMVTASLPPFTRTGAQIDVTVSAIGDSKNLLGGVLLVTPLLGADGEVYSVAQGSVAVSGFEAAGKAATISKGVTTSGRIASGATVERELAFDMDAMETMKIALRNPDFTTARRVADAINHGMALQTARATDPGTVLLTIPATYRGNVVALMTQIEQFPVTPDSVARVVIDERSGIVVMGENVRISTVAIAQGNLTIRITETPQVSQPGALARAGQTAVVDRTNIQVDEGKDNRLAIVSKGGVSLQELVNGLNALGVGPRDLIGILQAIKAAGALQAEIEVI